MALTRSALRNGGQAGLGPGQQPGREWGRHWEDRGANSLPQGEISSFLAASITQSVLISPRGGGRVR